MKDFEVKLKVPESKYSRWNNSYKGFIITIEKEDEVIFDDIRVNSDKYDIEKENEKEYTWSHKTPLEEFQNKKAVWYLDLVINNDNRRYYITDVNLGNMLKFDFIDKKEFEQQIKNLVFQIKTEEEEKIKAEKIASYNNNFFVKNKAMFEDSGWPVVSLEEYLKRTYYTGIDVRKEITYKNETETFRIEIDGDYISAVRNYDNKKKTRKWDAERVIKNVNILIEEWKRGIDRKINEKNNKLNEAEKFVERFKLHTNLILIAEKESKSQRDYRNRYIGSYDVYNYYLTIGERKISISEKVDRTWNDESKKYDEKLLGYVFNGLYMPLNKTKTLIDLLNS